MAWIPINPSYTFVHLILKSSTQLRNHKVFNWKPSTFSLLCSDRYTDWKRPVRPSAAVAHELQNRSRWHFFAYGDIGSVCDAWTKLINYFPEIPKVIYLFFGTLNKTLKIFLPADVTDDSNFKYDNKSSSIPRVFPYMPGNSLSYTQLLYPSSILRFFYATLTFRTPHSCICLQAVYLSLELIILKLLRSSNEPWLKKFNKQWNFPLWK